MAFYDLSKLERSELVTKISQNIFDDLQTSRVNAFLTYFADDDTYLRKSAYLTVGRIYAANSTLQNQIIKTLKSLSAEDNFKIRQTVINAAGEIGKHDFEIVQELFDKGLFDTHHSPRNAVIGSIKKMGEVNPVPVLAWAKKYLHHANKEIRREICHGIELRGRKHPADILPLLRELQFDKTRRVRSTLVHVIGQIAYKKECIETVISHLKDWENKELVTEALKEILEVHHRYSDFAAISQKQAEKYLLENIPERLSLK